MFVFRLKVFPNLNACLNAGYKQLLAECIKIAQLHLAGGAHTVTAGGHGR